MSMSGGYQVQPERPLRTNSGRLRQALDRLARAYEADPDKRRNLLQEIHVALWLSFEKFEGRCSLKTWVYRVAHNTATSVVIRRKVRAPAFVGLEEVEGALQQSGAPSVDQQETLEHLWRDHRPFARKRRHENSSDQGIFASISQWFLASSWRYLSRCFSDPSR
jgi:DNA-directed RNA polymerase specialized sigma24 family protein